MPKQATAWLHSLSGLPRMASWGYQTSALVLELRATDRGLSYRLKAPSQTAAYAVGQLRVLLPGIRVTPIEAEAPQSWTRVAELGGRRYTRTFRVPDPGLLAANLLATTQGLRRGEALLLQLVVVPTAPERPPARGRAPRPLHLGPAFLLPAPTAEKDAVTDQRNKLAEVNLLAVLRVAVQTTSDARMRQLLGNVRAVLTSVRTADNGFYARLVSQRRLRRRVNLGLAPLLFPIQLSASELTGLLAWPLNDPHVAGLPQARTRHLPPTEAISRTGLIVATANMPGAERPLAITFEDSNKHLHCVGPTGTGKTVLLSGLAVQAAAHGSGVVVLESKGALFDMVLDTVPKERLGDVIVLDLADQVYPLGFNILREGAPRVVVEELCALFEHLYRDTRSVWTREVLYHGLSTLVTQPGYTFVDLVPLLVPMTSDEEAWRDELIRGLTDRELRNFWQRFLNQPRATQDRMTQPVTDRVWQLNARPELRNIIGQSTSSFSMREVVEEGRILLINLAGVGQATAGLTGTLLMNALWNAVKASSRRRQVHLLLDEFQDFLQLPVNPADLFNKARQYRLALAVAHQNLGQLPPELREAILANAHSKVVFQTAADDARAFAREFGRQVDDQDFLSLGKYEVLLKLAAADGVSQPVTGVARPPRRSTGSAEEVRARSRQRYGRPVAAVEAEIAERRKPSDQPPRKRPKLGGQEWS
jgi:hypothetical protein